LRDTDAKVRAAAARGSALYGAASLTPVLLARLEEEEEPEAMIALIDAVGELGDARAAPVLAEIARGVSGLFRRHPVAVRVAALRALGRIGTPEAREAVAEFRHDRSEELRRAAHDALR
jgi:HEAT repeat protein